LHLLAERLEVGQVGVRHPRNAEARTERLQLRADRVGLQQLGEARLAHACSPKRQDLHHAEGLETAERLAHRRLAGSELPGHPRLDDPRVGRVAARKDVLQEAVLDLVREHAARDGAVV
jgi:hypothetical protein